MHLLRIKRRWLYQMLPWLPASEPATLVYDMFGGSIHRIRVEGGGTHYFNKITGQYVDLTREQFDLYNIEVAYEPNETMQREYCCKNPDTNARYRQLQRNIIAYLKNNED